MGQAIYPKFSITSPGDPYICKVRWLFVIRYASWTYAYDQEKFVASRQCCEVLKLLDALRQRVADCRRAYFY